MRITNGMMANNTRNNINTNKALLDKLSTQMSSQKKINRPSDDPVVAIRALRLRSNLSELNQYYEKNISDATALLDVTEEALSNITSLLGDMYDNCVYGSNDPLTTQDRNTIVTSLTSLKEQLYAEGNADYAGRNLFTGYKTNSNLTFMEADSTASYNITETFTGAAVESFTYVSGSFEVDKSTLPTDASGFEKDVASNTVHRIRLAYDGLENGLPTITYTDNSVVPPVTTTIDAADIAVFDTASDAAYTNVASNGVSYIANTGELILSEEVYKALRDLKADADGNKPISISYDKTGFSKGELRPEHYFDCTDKVSGTLYTKEEQAIEYTINFNQKIKVNTEGSDVLTHNIGRDVDEILDAVSDTIAAEEKVKEIKKLIEDPQYSDETSQKTLNFMLAAAEKELTLKEDKMQKLFNAGQTKFQDYQMATQLQVTDVGSRVKRIELTESRLAAQQVTFDTLKSENENVNLSDVMLESTAAAYAYEASLMAAGKTVSQSLLNFI